ncbi:lipocalin family protein [Pontiellaceae bacterium B12227]|nr:lipocalin family protein [Pontiellaceae bacterium B12227]
MKTIFTALVLLALAGCKSTSHLKVVSDFDAERYTGIWYEAARYPHRFEKGMSAVSATYSLNDDGTIKVQNRGYLDKKSKWKEIEGVAKFKGAANEGWLKVSFFKPFYASYKIIYLDDSYRNAIIAGPSYGYLWILTRDPDLPKAELDQLISRARNFGYDEEKIILVDQQRNQL